MCAIVISIGRVTNILTSSLLLFQFEQFWDSWGWLVTWSYVQRIDMNPGVYSQVLMALTEKWYIC